MQITSWIKLFLESGPVRIERSWQKAIDAFIFASHIGTETSGPSDLRLLAEEWEQRYELSQHLVWCPVGSILHSERYISGKNYQGGVAGDPSARRVVQSAFNEQLRFLEAGEFAERPKNMRLFVRQGNTPIIECIRIAMEECKEDPWAIIA